MLLDIFDPKAAPRAIGIDLGTTNSIVAYVRDGAPSALITCDGASLLPSVVHYGSNGAVLVGRAYVYGLGAGGGPGVTRAIEILRADLLRTLRLLGCGSTAELDRSYLELPSGWPSASR